jgi:hypothetical protein
MRLVNKCGELITPAGLIGMNVNLIVSDPWEFGGEHGTGPFSGRILQVASESSGDEDASVLFRLDDPPTFRGERYEYLIGTPRLEKDKLENLVSGARVNFNFIRISEDKASSVAPFDLSAWRGGGALIGTLEAP